MNSKKFYLVTLVLSASCLVLTAFMWRSPALLALFLLVNAGALAAGRGKVEGKGMPFSSSSRQFPGLPQNCLSSQLAAPGSTCNSTFSEYPYGSRLSGALPAFSCFGSRTR